MEKFDIGIIGGGTAGYIAGIKASQLGKKVCIIEKDVIGGVCLHQGCIPTKTLLATAEIIHKLEKSEEYGIIIKQKSIDFTQIIKRKDRIVTRLYSGINFLVKKCGIEVIKGVGRIKDIGCIEVNGKEIKVDNIIICTGSLPIIPFEIDKNIITSKEALELSNLPEDITIIGGGAIGVEFATIFANFGVKVTLVEMLPTILPEIKDKKILQIIKKALEAKGIKIYENTKVNRIEKFNNNVICILSSGENLLSEKVLIACGRKPNIDEFKDIVKIDGGKISVNEYMETNVHKIYSAGDVTGAPLLAHKASKEGEVAAENACGIKSKIDYFIIPNCIYSIPEIAYVGNFEEELYNPLVGEYNFAGIGRALCLGEEEGFVKVVCDKNGIIKGMQIIGTNAVELIEIGCIGIKNKLKAEELGKMVYPHPTLSECIKEALLDVSGMAIHKVKK